MTKREMYAVAAIEILFLCLFFSIVALMVAMGS